MHMFELHTGTIKHTHKMTKCREDAKYYISLNILNDIFVVNRVGGGVGGVMVFKATFNNILVISWRSFLLNQGTWRKPQTSH